MAHKQLYLHVTAFNVFNNHCTKNLHLLFSTILAEKQQVLCCILSFFQKNGSNRKNLQRQETNGRNAMLLSGETRQNFCLFLFLKGEKTTVAWCNALNGHLAKSVAHFLIFFFQSKCDKRREKKKQHTVCYDNKYRNLVNSENLVCFTCQCYNNSDLII